jgi:chromosome segregation ATPase
LKKAESKLSSDVSVLESEKESLLSDMKDAWTQAEEAKATALAVKSELASAKSERNTAREQAVALRSSSSFELEAIKSEKGFLLDEKKKQEARIAALEQRLNELLSHRAHMAKQIEVVGGAMKRVETNVNTICAMRRREAAGES